MRCLKQQGLFILLLALTGLLAMGCDEGSTLQGMDQDRVAETLRTTFPDYSVSMDGCEGMTWGGETEAMLKLLPGYAGWAVLFVEQSPMCAGPVPQMIDAFINLLGRDMDAGDVLDELQQNGFVETKSGGTGGTVVVGTPSCDPHPQPAISDAVNDSIDGTSDPHPQPATSNNQTDYNGSSTARTSAH